MGILVIIAGFAGSGKSTLAEKLAKKLKLRCIHASGLLRQLQAKKFREINPDASGMNSGWWESGEGRQYMKKRLADGSMDRELDKELLKLADEAEKKKEGMVLDSWTMPWLCKKGFKIWLSASPETRAKRAAGRDGIPPGEALKRVLERDSQTKKIYEKLYGFKLGEDFRPFHLVLETDGMDEEQVFREAGSAVGKHFNMKR